MRVDNVIISPENLTTAARALITQLGVDGVKQFGGTKWWQWRRTGDELRAEWIEMKGDYNVRKKLNERAKRIMLYVHGGAYFFGSVDEHRYQMQRHARKLGARVFAPRYRLAPQFPFPCGLQDCLAAYIYLLKEHHPSEVILAGDSAGGGMVVSMLVVLRDQGLPLPAGGILISPWVDLTHSFPSVAGSGEHDYIPAHGFMQKPSAAWPPPNEDDLEAIAKHATSSDVRGSTFLHANQDEQKYEEATAIQGLSVGREKLDETRAPGGSQRKPPDTHTQGSSHGHAFPNSGRVLSVDIDGKMTVLRDQFQMYATNQQISHPLVSPVLQPSLGGLPPLLILTGGGEILQDEQIYLAHKAASPAKYPPGDAHLDQYDPDRTLLHKYKPTNVQLQVWDDLCHVAVTLSFTRPAKFMYRSVAQFGAWALARAQGTSIEISDDDYVSLISSGSETDSRANDSFEKLAKHSHVDQVTSQSAAQIGRAGSPLPNFVNHMIRQQVDRHGMVHALARVHALPALQMAPAEIGILKAGLVQRWLEAKHQWDTRYAKQKRKAQESRIHETAIGGVEHRWGSDEKPPPTAVAGRRHAKGEHEAKVEARKQRSWGMMLWSLWGSKHDEHTLRREGDMVRREEKERKKTTSGGRSNMDERIEAVRKAKAEHEAGDPEVRHRALSSQRTREASGQAAEYGRSRSRRRTMIVTDTGQTEEQEHKEVPEGQVSTSMNGTPASHLTPGFVPKHRTIASLRGDTIADSSSMRTTTTTSTVGQGSLRTVSTTAVFATAGVVRPEEPGREPHVVSTSGFGAVEGDMRSERASMLSPETPASVVWKD